MSAGVDLTSGDSNIFIGNPGASNDSHVIRIGTAQSSSRTSTYHTRAFIAGINNATVTGTAVLIDPLTGQLGVASSSERYKEDIRDIGDSSEAIMQLRPVSFHYKQPAGNGSKPLQYGLIGEEVAGVYPELVVYGRDGQVESVQYHELPALLLNELQKQHQRIEQEELQIGKQDEEIRSLRAQLAEIQTLLQVERQAVRVGIHVIVQT